MGEDLDYERLLLSLKCDESRLLSEQSRVLCAWAIDTVADSQVILDHTAAIAESILASRVAKPGRS